ncbi:Bug family tripartite tricarboxylate transporter substrate binding protein [Cupriavidus sp. 30B13]|uniref:Bug family tripartite tricarboxylate transporter substrate binding protein n=1 Tax=Cupriavidus sp. 30B13 TaxID=3384241 RepID=UPI003B9013E8
MQHKLAFLLLAGSLCASAAPAAWPQAYPSRPIRLVVPFPAGGVTDTVSRIFGRGLADQLRQPVVVDNKAGASGAIGAEAVAGAPADGYTLMVGNISTLAVNRVAFAKLPYDPLRSFTSVSMISRQPMVLVSAKDAGKDTIAKLQRQAKEKKGGLNFGSGGASFELLNAAFEQNAGVVSTNIRYKGDTEALSGILSGEIDLMFSSLSSASSFLQADKVNGIAVTSEARSPLLPGIPTLRELGIPLEASSWQGLSAPAGTPAEIVSRLNEAARKVLQDPAVIRQFARLGVTATHSSPQEMQAFVADELNRWTKVGQSAGFVAQ